MENKTDSFINTSVENSSSPEDYVCQSENVHYFIHSSFMVAVIIIIVMSFMNRRLRWKTDCCNAKPGLAVPINLLDDYDNRWSYAFSFGAITNTIVILFMGPEYFEFPAPQVAKVFIGLVTALEVCVIFFPLFACIKTRHVMAGSMIGFIYSAIWLYASITHLINCMADPIPEVLPYAGLVLSLPNIVCLTAVAVRYLVYFIKACCGKAPKKVEVLAEKWQINYVKDRINFRERTKNKKCCQKVSEFIAKYIYEKEPRFKYSSRIICSLFVVVCCTYQLGLVYMLSNAQFSKWARESVNEFVNMSQLPANDSLVENLYLSVDMLNVSWQAATVLSLALFAINIIFIILKYRNDLFKLFQGKKEFIPSSILKLDSSEIVRNCMLFAGFQIAYMVWGYFVLNFALWVLAVLFCFLIILPLVNGNTDVIVFFANFCIIPLIVSILLRFIQTVMSSIFFLQDKIEKKDKHKPLALDNRRSFHLANYFFFMANIETGLFSCLYRIIQGLIFGLIFLGRLDRCVLMSGLEPQDKGYSAYLGMLYLEHTHNNPVLRVFCHIVAEVPQAKRNKLKIATIQDLPPRKGEDDESQDGTENSHLGAHGNTSGEIETIEIQPNNKEQKQLKQQTFNAEENELDEITIELKRSTATKSVTSTMPAEDKHRLLQHRWHILVTLVNNPQLVLCRKRNIENKEPAIIKNDYETVINTYVKYEQYRKLKDEIREVEDQIYGTVSRAKLSSVACQTEMGYRWFAPLFGLCDVSRGGSLPRNQTFRDDGIQSATSTPSSLTTEIEQSIYKVSKKTDLIYQDDSLLRHPRSSSFATENCDSFRDSPTRFSYHKDSSLSNLTESSFDVNNTPVIFTTKL